MESFELTMTKLCSGQEISIKINQRGVIHKRNKVVTVLCTALQMIARNMHTKFEVILTYGDKVTLQTRNAL